VDDLSATAYLTAKFSRTRGAGWSYGGYEKNRLYLNRRGMAFVEIGHLMGVALEQDSRNVVADDLDGDGRMDLLVTTFEVWPEPLPLHRPAGGRKENENWSGINNAMSRRSPKCRIC